MDGLQAAAETAAAQKQATIVVQALGQTQLVPMHYPASAVQLVNFSEFSMLEGLRMLMGTPKIQRR